MATYKITKAGFVGNVSGSVTGSLLGTASYSTTAGQVAWTNVTGKPSFAGLDHNHSGSIIWPQAVRMGTTSNYKELTYNSSTGFTFNGTVTSPNITNIEKAATTGSNSALLISQSAGTSGAVSLNSNTYTVLGTLTGNITFTTGTTYSNVANEFAGQFSIGSSVVSVTFPSLQWIYGRPSIEANKTYVFSILNGIAVMNRTE